MNYIVCPIVLNPGEKNTADGKSAGGLRLSV